MVKIESVDVVVTAYFVDWSYFTSNVKSWLEELPVRTLYFGCSNPNVEYIEELRSYLSQYDKIEFIDQRGFKTLGMCLADLMKRVETEFFVFVHADAWLSRHSFLVMEAEMEDHVGIVESERVQYKYEDAPPYPTEYAHYYYYSRSFSGYQLFRMEAIKEILVKIEDDYIYRNEDLIFQNVCSEKGFHYQKAFAMHVHTCSKVSQKWTPQGDELEDPYPITYDMQIKGIVKYCTPTDITKKAWRDAFGIAFSVNKIDLFKFVDDFVMKVNPVWRDAIQETISDLLISIYK